LRIVGGSLRGRRLEAPEGSDVRPTSDRAREALFNILQHSPLAPEPLAGATFLDLFAGTGAVACEALSRGAAHAVLVEQDARVGKLARANIEALGLAQRTTLLAVDAQRLGPATARTDAPAAFAFLDPPYRSGLALPALSALAGGGWLAPDALCVVEVAATEPFAAPDGFEQLDERRYGAARQVFLREAGQPPAR
jgi:16S rRNA (guanine966-N2)-methyltransferase